MSKASKFTSGVWDRLAHIELQRSPLRQPPRRPSAQDDWLPSRVSSPASSRRWTMRTSAELNSGIGSHPLSLFFHCFTYAARRLCRKT